MPLLQVCDIINYLSYASLYLEMMRNLPQERPEIYKKFKLRHLAVKINDGSFNEASPNIKLEETILR